MTTHLTPLDMATSTQVGRHLFRKQVLKKGTINYKGQKVTFDDAFINDCVKSFNAGAYDQVPFVFADPNNRHNMDPERFRGEIKGFELTPDGMDAFIEATADGAKVIKKNPRLGVSARIVQELDKGDGRTFKRAVQHVLATMDPRLTGMRPWEAVDLSGEEDDDDVIDLTAASTKEGTRVATKIAKKAAARSITIDLAEMSDKQFELLLAATATADPETESDEDEDDEDEDEDETVEEVTSKQTVKRKGFPKVVEETDDDEEDDDEDPDEDDEDDAEDDEPAAKKAKKKVSLSNPVKKVKLSKSRRLAIELAADRFERKRGDYLRAGVPPVLLDLAAPLLAQPDRLVIDLSETGEENVDARTIVAKILDEVQGMIDLTPEIGHSVGTVPDKDSPTGAALAQWDKEYGKA